jgi:hypothetical protein
VGDHHHVARNWLTIFAIAAAISLVVAITEHGKTTVGYVAWAVASGVVLASGITFGGARLKGRGDARAPFWIVALVIIVLLAFLGARAV